MLRHAIALLFSIPFANAAQPDLQVLLGLTAGLQRIEASNPDGSVSVGTGVMVAPGYVVTNCHVTQRALKINVVRGALHHPVELQHGDVERDLCILHAPGAAQDPVATLREEPPRIGEQVHAIGFIFGVSPRFNSGEVNALFDFDGGKVIRSSAPFTSGASGGGLFDAEGRVVGIVTFKYRAGAAHHYSLPISWVNEALRRFRGAEVGPLPGTPFWQRPRERQPYFLQAATLEAEDNWFGLLDLAQEWSRREPANSTSWYTLGKAHQRLEQHEQCIDAYRKAVSLDGRNAEAWYRLGIEYGKAKNAQGSAEAYQRSAEAYRALLDLDIELARRLENSGGECAGIAAATC